MTLLKRYQLSAISQTLSYLALVVVYGYLMMFLADGFNQPKVPLEAPVCIVLAFLLTISMGLIIFNKLTDVYNNWRNNEAAK